MKGPKGGVKCRILELQWGDLAVVLGQEIVQGCGESGRKMRQKCVFLRITRDWWSWEIAGDWKGNVERRVEEGWLWWRFGLRGLLLRPWLLRL